MVHMCFRKIIFIAVFDYENIFTMKISRFKEPGVRCISLAIEVRRVILVERYCIAGTFEGENFHNLQKVKIS